MSLYTQEYDKQRLAEGDFATMKNYQYSFLQMPRQSALRMVIVPGSDKYYNQELYVVPKMKDNGYDTETNYEVYREINKK